MDNQFIAGQVAMISRGHWIVAERQGQQAQHGHRHPAEKESDITVIGFGGYAINKTHARMPISPRR